MLNGLISNQVCAHDMSFLYFFPDWYKRCCSDDESKKNVSLLTDFEGAEDKSSYTSGHMHKLKS